ncbi:vWA domain-containing protein [Metabacillus fastidiosus]|uniref:vWA domain-containing protein n=1 Tax=Metabacillus fastidiosus TaxID=1458 RepID=UPI002E23D3F2|nr:VWA domain-containing protein [Metabacillus fastidiosus]
MRFIKFNDEQVDSFFFMELLDLAKCLTKRADLEIEYSVQSYIDPIELKVYISHFWEHRKEEEVAAGLKSDIYLRSIGSFSYTDFNTVNHFIRTIKNYKFRSFAKQLFMIAEDIRLEEIVKRERRGTIKAFQMRRDMYRRHFESQLTINRERSIFTDALFNAVYLKLTAQSPLETVPSLNERIDLAFPYIESEMFKVYEAKSTDDIAKIVENIMEVAEEILEKDMLNTYFFLPELDYDLIDCGFTVDDLKRKSKLKNDDTIEDVRKGDEDIHDDKLSTWHSETSTPTQSFLQYDLEQGTKTDLIGEGVRDSEDGDQALGTVQGTSKKTKNNDFSKLQSLESSENDKERSAEGDLTYGKENKYAVPVFVEARIPKGQEIENYTANKKEILSYQKKLKQMIQKTLEHKKIYPRTDLHIGRLNKKLLRLLTYENPRLFYKKDQPSPEIDAVFTLLVDCSASMYDKMEQTKLGITLFHEALKSVRVPHQIVGFWEDTNEASETYQPNHFHRVIPFERSLQTQTGPEIMQLAPEEDNRDGYAIRHMTKELMKRQEKQKFLLVFSDGEPAALGYDQNGIIDTHEAVIEARKLGIEVINVFLANGEIDEAGQKTIQNIYGKFSIFVQHIEDLPEQLFPLLKRLLLKTL